MSKPFIIPIFLPHAGCPHRCVFCNQTAITGNNEPFPSAEGLRGEIDRLMPYKGKNRGKTEISFFGGNFLGLPPEKIRMCLDVAAAYADSQMIDSIRCSTRPDTITPETLKQIAPFPVRTIEIGVQSMAENVLALSRRGHDAAAVRQAMALLKQAGYQTGIQVMIGLPGDNAVAAALTAREIVEMAPDFVRIYPTLVIKGSPLARWYREKRYTPLSLAACVARLKQLYHLFTKNQIKVIRMGLQATEGLSADNVIAGPYHPALGHMVLSTIMLDQATHQLQHISLPRHHINLRIHPKSISRMQGLNKQNLTVLKDAFDLTRICLLPDPEMPELSVIAE
ncbi:MAG: radical SAM protein [Desulfobacterales bacterium]|nr:radical SAM protein [Desulfobacterales bacterium]